jgi:hypothetical protein
MFGILLVGTFLVEVGRMSMAATRVEFAADAGSRGGAERYARSLETSLREGFAEVRVQAEEEASEEAELAGESLSEEEFEKRVVEKQRELVAPKISTYRSTARSECKATIFSVIQANKVEPIAYSCSDEKAQAEALVQYVPVLPGLSWGRSSFLRSASHTIELSQL